MLAVGMRFRWTGVGLELRGLASAIARAQMRRWRRLTESRDQKLSSTEEISSLVAHIGPSTSTTADAALVWTRAHPALSDDDRRITAITKI